MKKKTISVALALVLALTVSPAASAAALSSAAALVAKPTASTVLVDGKSVAFDAYTINDNNYFKLRDLAFVLSGTAKQFDVGWDDANDAISLTSGKPYTVAGGEMASKGAGDKKPAVTASKIFLNGKEAQFTAYNIDENNYFKLRDIGQAIDFGVDWDEAKNTIAINTNKGYTQDGGTTANRQTFKVDSGEVRISVPVGWQIIQEEGSLIPATEQTYNFELLPPPTDKEFGVVTVGKTVGGKTLSPTDFISIVTTRAEQLLPEAVEKTAKYIDVDIDGGFGVYFMLTDASMVGKTPEPDEYMYLYQFFVNLENGYLIYATILSDVIDSAPIKVMLDIVAGIEPSFK